MQVSNYNNVKIYSITSASYSALPDWLARRNAKSLKKDVAWRTRIELIQDFEFPEASIKLKASRDGQYLMATGVYKPQMRVYDLSQLAMKFERHMDCENVTFEILSDDWTKSVHLQSDRTIEFHTQFGLHYKTRVPRVGRDMVYHYPSCDLMVACSSPEVYRLNLEQGRFMSSYQTLSPAINVAQINSCHQLLAFGGDDGQLEFWHPNQRNRIARLNVGASILESVDSSLLDRLPDIRSLAFAEDGLQFAVGTSTGHVLLYDLRRPTPMLLKDHQYGFPIHSLSYHSSGNIISGDTKIVKIWNKDTGKIFTSIEAPSDINNVCTFKDSGLIMLANEGTQMQSYYIPALGPAPRWCPFLDNLTEELEENPNQNIYDDYKFVTRKELSSLGLDHLIGTSVLKAYMHGFFVDMRLYEKARAIANPFQLQEHRRRMIEKKLDEQRKSRISAIKKLPAVNKNMAAKFAKLDEEEDGKDEHELIWNNGRDSDVEDDQDSDDAEKTKTTKKKSKKNKMGNLLEDDRFSAMFKEEDFHVDETSREYQLHYPSSAPKGNTLSSVADHLEDANDVSDNESIVHYNSSDPEGNASDDDFDSESDVSQTETKPARVKPQMHALKSGSSAMEVHSKLMNTSKTSSWRSGENTDKNGVPADASFAARIQKMKKTGANSGGAIRSHESGSRGNMSLSFSYKNNSGRGRGSSRRGRGSSRK